MQAKKCLSGASQSQSSLTIEDVFHVNVRTGTGVTTNIVTGIDGIGNDVLTWIKARSVSYGSSSSHCLFDTARGAGQVLNTNSTSAECTYNSGFNSFNSDGFTLGADSSGWINYNTASEYVDYTFAKAPRFFDMVKYTGNGVAGREIPHNLGCDVGMIIVKRTDGAGNWYVQHISTGGTKTLFLDTTSAATVRPDWGSVDATDTHFTVSGDVTTGTNYDTFEYIAYLFAHDPLGASGDSSDGMIACGSYVGNGSVNSIDLGWEPQYLMVKASSKTADWIIFDSMRGMTTGATIASQYLSANTSSSEATIYPPQFDSTGFTMNGDGNYFNTNAETYIYMAIRNGLNPLGITL